jgi:hypothetical protein
MKNNVIAIPNNTNQKSKKACCDLSKYEKQSMVCPVTTARDCYFVPLDEINGMKSNPGRSGGTQQTKVTEICESLITSPKGQEEPICLEWNSTMGEWDFVFGCHREWATRDAYEKGFEIANHPKSDAPGIWAWPFIGTAAERVALQMRENGDKKPQSPATKQQMVSMLKQYIKDGGLTVNYPVAFEFLSDKDKYDRARAFMKKNTPYWGGRRFQGVWNKLVQDGTGSVTLDFKTYSKRSLAEYFANNNPYGIKFQDFKPSYSGSIVKINGVVYGVYFFNVKNEIAGALPTNASKSQSKNKIDHMILVGSLNDSSPGAIVKNRSSFEDEARWWNNNIYDVFSEVFWMPQTKKERDSHILSGTWASKISL